MRYREDNGEGAVDQRHRMLADREELRKQTLPAGPPAHSPPT